MPLAIVELSNVLNSRLKIANK